MAEVKNQLATMEVVKYVRDTLNTQITEIGSISNKKLTLGSSSTSQCIINVNGVKRQLIFNSDGTVTWQSV